MERLERMAVHLEFGKIILIVGAMSILLTSLIHFLLRKYPKYRIVKFIPGFIFTIVGFYNLFRIGIELPNTDEFNMLLATVIFIVGGLVGLLSGLIIGVISKKKS